MSHVSGLGKDREISLCFARCLLSLRAKGDLGFKVEGFEGRDCICPKYMYPKLRGLVKLDGLVL